MIEIFKGYLFDMELFIVLEDYVFEELIDLHDGNSWSLKHPGCYWMVLE